MKNTNINGLLMMMTVAEVNWGWSGPEKSVFFALNEAQGRLSHHIGEWERWTQHVKLARHVELGSMFIIISFIHSLTWAGGGGVSASKRWLSSNFVMLCVVTHLAQKLQQNFFLRRLSPKRTGGSISFSFRLSCVAGLVLMPDGFRQTRAKDSLGSHFASFPFYYVVSILNH